jgi:C1A family cysteine protease
MRIPSIRSTINPAQNLEQHKHIQRVIYILIEVESLDNNNIKKLWSIMGRFSPPCFFDDASYNPDNYSYYYRGNNFSNHAVCLVGWDDNYDRKKIQQYSSGRKGAFIVRNSWEAPGATRLLLYFYYDTRIGTNNALFNNAESPENYDIVHQYDPLGWVASAGYNSPSACFANVFTAENKEDLMAVSWYVSSGNADYELMVYTNPQSGNPRSGGSVLKI